MKRIAIVPLFVCLSGCIDLELDPFPQSFVLTTQIQRGGHGTIHLELQNITSSKEGAEGERRVAEFLRDCGKADGVDPQDFLPGCTNVTHSVAYDSDGKPKLCIQGEFPDIFVMLKFLDGHYRLRKDATFSFQWDGDVLSVKLGQRRAKEESEPAEDDFACKVVITTEGEFVSSTWGKVSDNRKKLVIENVDAIDDKQWQFSIRGLSED
jgi:hypothetical protein